MSSTPEHDGHVQFADESGTWCYRDCPRPEGECGRLAVEQNDPSSRPDEPPPPASDLIGFPTPGGPR